MLLELLEKELNIWTNRQILELTVHIYLHSQKAFSASFSYLVSTLFISLNATNWKEAKQNLNVMFKCNDQKQAESSLHLGTLDSYVSHRILPSPTHFDHRQADTCLLLSTLGATFHTTLQCHRFTVVVSYSPLSHRDLHK